MAILNADELSRAIKSGKRAPCWLLFSTDEYLLDASTRALTAALGENAGEGATVLPGPVPEIGRVVEAAGAISMFGGRRIVVLRHMEPTQMRAEDITLLAELCAQLESAYLIFTVLVKDNAPKWTKNAAIKLPAAAKALQAAVEKNGIAAALEKPNDGSAAGQVARWAKELGAEMEKDAAQELVERCGVDLLLLHSETEKLAAASGYGKIDTALVRAMATRNIEADVFELSRHILAGRADRAFTLLGELFYLQNEPVMIAAALSGAYLDMYRVACGAQAHVGYAQVFKELGYKGSDYRLKKSAEAAAGYSVQQLAECLAVLARLDKKLKGSSMDNKQLLELAVGELLLCGPKRRGYARK